MKALIRPVALISSSLVLLLLLSFAAEASGRRYRPKKPGRYGGRTTTTGVRGSCEDSKTPLSLTAIAPLSHVGQTSSAQPTLAWYVPNQKAYNLEVRLLQADDATQRRTVVWQSPKGLRSSFGVMQQQLPKTVNLTPNTTYIWQVTLFCNPNRPSQDQTTEVPMQLVPGAQADADSRWYDLLQEANGNANTVKGLIQDLLEAETSPPSDEAKEHNTRLKEVMGALQPVAN
jgi:hypothetical protein